MDVSVMCGRAAAGGTVGGELAIGRDHRAAALYPAGLRVEPHHDAAMRIGGEAPSGGPILYRGDEAIVRRGTSQPRVVSAALCGCAAEVRAA